MVEKLFEDIQSMQIAMPIHAEEKLFIDAIRGLNHEAQKLQAQEFSSPEPDVDLAEAKLVESLNKEPTKVCNRTSQENLINETLAGNTEANNGNCDLSINSCLFPRTSSSERERDSSVCSEEEPNSEGKRQKTTASSAMDEAALAVLKAADRVQNLAPSPNLKCTMNWMTAIQSKASSAQCVDQSMESITVSDKDKRKRKIDISSG